MSLYLVAKLQECNLDGKSINDKLQLFAEFCFRAVASQLSEEQRLNLYGDLRKVYGDFKYQEYVPPSTLQDKFTLCKPHIKALAALEKHLAILELKKKNPQLATYGPRGLLLEGPSGIGKSTLIKRWLKEKGYQNANVPPDAEKKFYQLTPDNLNNLQETLKKAFHEGAIVVIDEINRLPIEYLLNSYLQGVDTEGNAAQKEGFYIFATQNPGSFDGRMPLSEALRARFETYILDDYSPEDLKRILQQRKVPDDLAEELITDFCDCVQHAQTHNLRLPTLRHLLTEAERMKKEQQPQPHCSFWVLPRDDNFSLPNTESPSQSLPLH